MKIIITNKTILSHGDKYIQLKENIEKQIPRLEVCWFQSNMHAILKVLKSKVFKTTLFQTL